MRYKTILGLLLVFITYSCAQHNGKSKTATQKESNPVLELQQALRIVNGPNRGTFFTNSKGIAYSHSHKTITLANESDMPLTLNISLPNQYALPAPYQHEFFKIVLWPEKLLPEKESLIDSLSTELRTFFESDFNTPHRIHKVIAPGESYKRTIGTWHIPTDSYASVIGFSLDNNTAALDTCTSLVDEDTDTSPAFPILLNLNFSDVGCRYVPFGEISYSLE